VKNNSIELVYINPSFYPKSFLRDGFFAARLRKPQMRED